MDQVRLTVSAFHGFHPPRDTADACGSGWIMRRARIGNTIKVDAP